MQPGLISGNRGHDLGRMTRRAADRANAAFECGQAFLQNGNRGVGQAGVDKSDFLQVEQGGSMISIPEHIAGGLVDWGLPCASCRVGFGSGVDLQCVKAIAWCISHFLVSLIKTVGKCVGQLARRHNAGVEIRNSIARVCA